MNSFPVEITFGLVMAFVVAPLVSSAQSPKLAPTQPDVTLLTGPNLLSPATRPINSPSISSEIVTPPETTREIELEKVQQKLGTPTDRLNRLRAERAAALERKRQLDEAHAAALAGKKERNAAATGVPPQPATTPRTEPIRFETQLPPTPLALPRSTPPSPPPFKRD